MNDAVSFRNSLLYEECGYFGRKTTLKYNKLSTSVFIFGDMSSTGEGIFGFEFLKQFCKAILVGDSFYFGDGIFSALNADDDFRPEDICVSVIIDIIDIIVEDRNDIREGGGGSGGGSGGVHR